jgi:hypothetical protein
MDIAPIKLAGHHEAAPVNVGLTYADYPIVRGTPLHNPPQPNFQVTPTRPTLLFRQITWQDQNERPLSKVRSNLSGRSTGAPESKLIQAPSVFRLSTVQARPADASFTMILPA